MRLEAEENIGPWQQPLRFYNLLAVKNKLGTLSFFYYRELVGLELENPLVLCLNKGFEFLKWTIMIKLAHIKPYFYF